MVLARRNLLCLALLLVLPQVLVGLPAPQADGEVATTTPKPASKATSTRTTTTTEKPTADDDDYGDADVKKVGTKSKPAKKPSDGSSEENFDVGDAIEDIFEGAFGILQHTLKTASEVAKNMSLPEKVEGAVKTGLNITRDLVKMGGKILENPDDAIKEKKKLINALGKTIEETRPLVEAGVDELGKHVNLGTSFAHAYGGAMLDQLGGFVKVFENRLRCNSQCKKMDEGEERAACEDKFCKEIQVRNRNSNNEDDDEEESTSTRSGGKRKENLTKKKNKEEEEEEEVDEKEEKEKENNLE